MPISKVNRFSVQQMSKIMEKFRAVIGVKKYGEFDPNKNSKIESEQLNLSTEHRATERRISSIFNGIDCLESSRRLAEMSAVDKNSVSSRSKKITLDGLDSLKRQRFDVVIGESVLECYHVNSNTKKLYVFLSGAGRKGNQKTRFNRLTWAGVFDGHCLYIEDPMYKMFSDINVGWYYGTKTRSIMDDIVKLIRRFLDLKSIRNEDLHIIGSSCAGYAAIYIANKIAGATSISFNPQISPAIWDVRQRFENVTGINLEGEDEFGRNDISNLFENTTSRFVIVANILSERDYVKQIKPVFLKYNVKPYYGLNVINNTYVVLAEMSHPFEHGAFPGALETRVLISLLNNGAGNDDIVPYVEMLKNKFSVSTKLNYANLWSEFLATDFQGFITVPVFCDESSCILKVSGLPGNCYYKAHIDSTLSKCVVSFYIIEEGVLSNLDYCTRMREIATQSNASIKMDKNKILIFRPKLKHTELASAMTDFIEKTHYAIFGFLAV